MSKIQLAPIYAVIFLVFVILLFIMGQGNNKKIKSLRNQLILVSLMDLLYFFAFFAESEMILGGMHCIILIMQSWIALSMVDFAVDYTQTGLMVNKYVRNTTIFLLMIDSLMMLVNAFTCRFFDFEKKEFENMTYVLPELNGFYLFHIILLVCLMLVFIYVTGRAVRAAAKTRKIRYLILMISFILGLVACLAARIIGLNSNLVTTFVMSVGEAIIYVVYFILPITHENKMKEFAINNLSLPVVIFDDEERVEYANSLALEYIDVEIGQSIDSFIENSNLQAVLSPERRKLGKTAFFSSTISVGKRTFILSGQELRNKNGKYAGRILIYSDITNNEKLKNEAVYHATRDSLTGLWNREFFLETVDDILREKPDMDFVMIVSDLYRFKVFNDIMGMDAGDEMLIAIANALKGFDYEYWVAGRITGDRFALFMPAKDFNEEVFVNNCKNEIEKLNYRLKVHFYLGIIRINDRRLHAADIYDRAYMALESIKGSGEAHVVYYDEAIRRKKIDETLSIDQLEKAMEDNQFVIYLQPQINIITNRVNGCEALVRWDNPSRGIVPPGAFISAFENNGMIYKLDYYVWEKACALLAEWKKAGFTDRSISVNISAKDFYLMDLVESITGLVKKYDIEPEMLRLEITETAFVHDVEQQMGIVRQLQDYGFVVEIDDFGSGYSSLNSLKDITADILKLDMKFFKKSEDVERAEKIIESVIALAKKLDMPVVAEGVEEETQIEMLKRIGCKTVQGYYYAKPMPVDMFESFVKNFGGSFERI